MNIRAQYTHRIFDLDLLTEYNRQSPGLMGWEAAALVIPPFLLMLRSIELSINVDLMQNLTTKVGANENQGVILSAHQLIGMMAGVGFKYASEMSGREKL